MDLAVLEDGLKALAARWWILVIRGLAAIVFGILTFVAPRSSLYALVIIWGAYAIVDGVSALFFAVWRGRHGMRWGWWVFHGIVGIAAGLLTFVWPGMTALVLVTVIAVWAVLTGTTALVAAISLRRIISGEWLLATVGVLSLAAGVLLFVYPRSGALALVWVIGAYAIAAGSLLTALGLRLLGWRRHDERHVRTGEAPSAA